jgi:hypothetical protein
LEAAVGRPSLLGFSGQMSTGLPATKRCIYCPALLKSSTKWAHVWPESIGGRIKSREICCDDCNNALSPVEGAAYQALAFAVANLGGLRGDNKPVEVRATIMGFEAKMSSGFIHVRVPGVSFEPDTHKLTIPLPAGGMRVWARTVAPVLFGHGFEPNDLGRLILEPAPPTQIPTETQRREFNLAMTFPERRRFALKVPLELLAYHRHDLALRPELSSARRFVRRTINSSWQSLAVDGATEGSGLLPEPEPAEPYHAAEIWTRRRFVYFRIAFLFRPMAFTGFLCDDWSGEAFRGAYAFPIRAPGRFLTREFKRGDGPGLSPRALVDREKNERIAADLFEAASFKMAGSLRRPEPEKPPEIEALREAVRQELLRLEARKKR